MAPRPVTLSIADFCARTGVGRERLRTWERRHGFPQPVRTGDGPRRYDVDDVARVIVVQQAVRSGVTLVAAIRAARSLDTAGAAPPAPDDFHAEADHAPVPMLAVTGPEPLSVLWRNGYVRACAGSPAEGSELLAEAPSMRGSAAEDQLRGLLSGVVPGPVVVSHPDWCSDVPRRARSIAWRSAGRAGQSPVAVLLGVPDEPGTDGGAVREGGQSWIGAFCSAASSAAATLRNEVGPGAIIGAVEALTAGVGAADGALATYAAGNLLAGRSVRGLMAPRVVAVCAFDDLAAALHDGVVDWLGQPAREAFGIDGSQALLMVPVIAAGERLGVLLLSFTDELPLGDPERELLLAAATSIGFALLRQRAADQLAEPGG